MADLPLTKKYLVLTELLEEDEEIYSECRKAGDTYILDEQWVYHYPDLLRTLQIEPWRYRRPIVELIQHGYKVRGNNLFYRACKELNFNSIICDVLVEPLEQRHMSQFQVDEVPREERRYRMQSVFFVEDYPGEGVRDFQDFVNPRLLEITGDERVKFISRDIDCLEFTVPQEVSMEATRDAYAAAKELLPTICSVRSENGLMEVIQK